jgi:3-hydroxyisobutyrate dehydrogenase-like beta-hydroxyacid dehydrogenase
MSRHTVAVVGLGRMGGPMASNLVRAGHEVRVVDVAPEAVAARVAEGAIACATPAEAADGADVVCVVVFDDAQATEVLIGADGVLSRLAPGSVVALHTTVTLDTVRRLAREAEARGVSVLDAGISGGEEGAANGTLLTMLGGPADAVEAARPVLAAFSKEVLHAGPLGAGMALKLARNSVGYSLMVAVHESMAMAVRAGVDLSVLQHTLAETGVLAQGMSPFAIGGPEPLAPDDTAMRPAMEHVARLAEKDLANALELAAELDVELPLTAATRATFPRSVRVSG